MRTVLFGGLIGATLAYLLHPRGGAQWRGQARDKLSSLPQQVGRNVQQGGQVVTKVRQVVRRAPDNPNPDDLTLRDRVESEVFRDPSVPKGEFNLTVVDRVVELRGQLSSQQEIDDLIKKVRSVPDVQGVHSYLHLPGTPAPNKAEAIRVS